MSRKSFRLVAAAALVAVLTSVVQIQKAEAASLSCTYDGRSGGYFGQYHFHCNYGGLVSNTTLRTQYQVESGPDAGQDFYYETTTVSGSGTWYFSHNFSTPNIQWNLTVEVASPQGSNYTASNYVGFTTSGS